jgi:glucokinase
VRVAEHAGPLAAARAYLDHLARSMGGQFRPPGAAAWAVATAVTGEQVELTNAGWTFSRPQLQRELGLQSLLLLNDFEALALSLPHLQPQQLRPIGPATARTEPGAAMAVIGPGTGLGVATLMRAAMPAAATPPAPGAHAAARWLAVPGEGGHATLAAADDLECALLSAVRKRYEHVSAERLLSGIGLPVLHQAVAAVRGQPAPELAADAIVAAGLAEAGSTAADALCRETLQHFCALLGGFAGNVALTVGARGGLYIGGGIVPRLGDLFLQSRFRERFEAKGRFAPYLRAIPTWLIVDTRAALSGAVVALQQG